MSDFPCLCGSGGPVTDCCGPVLAGAPAPTAERLMRSRFTAYALGDVEHLVRSWHPATCPSRQDLVVDPGLRWTRLEVLDSTAGGLLMPTGTVEFRAHYQKGNTTGVLHENSRFVKNGGRWVYLGPEEADQG